MKYIIYIKIRHLLYDFEECIFICKKSFLYGICTKSSVLFTIDNVLIKGIMLF